MHSQPVYRFTDALVRRPAASATGGLRAVDRGAPSIGGLRAQHTAYIDALMRAGVRVHTLNALEDYPDALFVEDPALVFPQAAIVLRPGAPSRFGEAAEIRPELARHFTTLIDLPGPGYVDGGDILVTPDCVYIGLSARTDSTGADALAGVLRDLGRASRVVTPPAGVLHLKTACSLLDDSTLLATDTLANSGIISGLDIIRVVPGEEPVANALRVNDTVLLSHAYPLTARRLQEHGYLVDTVPLHDVELLDAGLSCMSLRWSASG